MLEISLLGTWPLPACCGTDLHDVFDSVEITSNLHRDLHVSQAGRKSPTIAKNTVLRIAANHVPMHDGDNKAVPSMLQCTLHHLQHSSAWTHLNGCNKTRWKQTAAEQGHARTVQGLHHECPQQARASCSKLTICLQGTTKSVKPLASLCFRFQSQPRISAISKTCNRGSGHSSEVLLTQHPWAVGVMRASKAKSVSSKALKEPLAEDIQSITSCTPEATVKTEAPGCRY
jgi:hypothetical protein